MTTLQQRLARSPLPRLEAHMLWQYVLGVPRAWLFAHDQDPLDAEQITAYTALEQRRLAGEPMAYILGEREFYGHRFAVTPDVLIPRPETECLVECGLDALRDAGAASVLELGTGSGAVAIALALARPDVDVTATDYSAAALAVAQKNARTLGASVEFHQGSWYDAGLGGKQYRLILANPPYVAAQDPHLTQGDLRYEPQMALTTNTPDGMQDLAYIIRGAPDRLMPDGVLCVEHGWDQADRVRALFEARGFIDCAGVTDLAGIVRVTQGRWPG